MSNAFYVRADIGTYAKQFVDGGNVAIGWMQHSDLSARDKLDPFYKSEHPDDMGNIVIGQQGARFLPGSKRATM